MNLDEALIIAQRIEDDDVVGPVGMALRVVLKELDHYNDGYRPANMNHKASSNKLVSIHEIMKGL